MRRRWFGLAAALCFLAVMFCAAVPAAASGAPLPAEGEAHELNELKGSGLIPGSGLTVTFTVKGGGGELDTVSEQGALEFNCILDGRAWSCVRISESLDGEERSFCRFITTDPLGSAVLLELRCFLITEDGEPCLCRVLTLTTEDGVLCCRSSSTLTLGGAKHCGVDFESSSEGNDRTEKRRTWSSFSSDGRLLWQVELEGVFERGICIGADGTAAAIDGAWQCTQSLFFPDGRRAVARVTFTRSVLGITVAERRYEFRLDFRDGY